MTTIKIPLLQDHHSHPLFYSAFGQAVSLEHVKSKDAAMEILKTAFVDSNNELTVAQGWRSNFYQWSQTEIEQLPPLAIFNVSLHSLLINETGKRILRARYGDIIDHVDDRNWYESNLRVVLNWFANLSASVETLRSFYDQLLVAGVYSVEEMLLVDENEIKLFEQAGLLDRTRFWAAPDTYESLTATAKNRVHGLKLFTDGAIGSRTAAMKRPFIGGSKSNHGMLVYPDEAFSSVVADCLASGKSLAIHAIGDRAIEQVIDTLEASGSARTQTPEIRIEHAQMITPDLARRAKDLGLVLSMQPNFSCDSADYTDRLDAEYCAMNNPFRMLIDEIGFVAGADLIFGSDGMPHGIEAAASNSFFPAFENQRLSVDEFVAGYCLPDETHGTIELAMDDATRTVRCKVLKA